MRQQFAGPLGSTAAMQMPALHFPLRPMAAAEASLWQRPAPRRAPGLGRGTPDAPLLSQEIESAAYKSWSYKPNLNRPNPDIDMKQHCWRDFLRFSRGEGIKIMWDDYEINDL